MNDTKDAPAPPPGLSRDNIEAVQRAREAVRTCGVQDCEPHRVQRELLAAYDALAARMAWLAARVAEHEDRYDGLA
jgi:hypothetical protein